MTRKRTYLVISAQKWNWEKYMRFYNRLGCGKTTLLSLLGGLDSPTKGKILFNGEDITEKDSQIIVVTMFPLSFKHIISLII